MIDKLKQILEDGVQSALQAQAEHTNHSYIMQGKGDAFKEVLLVIGQLEASDGEDTATEKDAAEE